ncbi:tripartite tricarboxylate transporter TctB family protein [uncultured Enterovirga sp.]|uniref:tripartite tricarboxylate transporter TctB family protein n=1 Tax=uncultured Enterovirga sp. TaxID=2026352 RepID=UPI0035CB92DD
MISRPNLERLTALLTGAFGVAVAVSSVSNGIGWSRAGVEAGTFPFALGLIVTAASVYNFVADGWIWPLRVQAIGWGHFKQSGALFLPAVALVVAMPIVGLHLAAALYVFGTYTVQSRISPLRAAAAGIATAACLYVLFDMLFQVSLPLGALGAALGF